MADSHLPITIWPLLYSCSDLQSTAECACSHVKFRFTIHIVSPPIAFSAVPRPPVLHPVVPPNMSITYTFYHLTPFAPLALLYTSCCSGCESPHFYLQLPSLPSPLLLLVLFLSRSPSPVVSPTLLSDTWKGWPSRMSRSLRSWRRTSQHL